MQLDIVGVRAKPGPDPFRAVGGVPVDHEMDLVVEVASEPRTRRSPRSAGDSASQIRQPGTTWRRPSRSSLPGHQACTKLSSDSARDLQ
jgi:hypothetical protein